MASRIAPGTRFGILHLRINSAGILHGTEGMGIGLWATSVVCFRPLCQDSSYACVQADAWLDSSHVNAFNSKLCWDDVWMLIWAVNTVVWSSVKKRNTSFKVDHSLRDWFRFRINENSLARAQREGNTIIQRNRLLIHSILNSLLSITPNTEKNHPM